MDGDGHLEDTVAVMCAIIGGAMVVFGDVETWGWKTMSLVGFLAVLMIACLIISLVRRRTEKRL